MSIRLLAVPPPFHQRLGMVRMVNAKRSFASSQPLFAVFVSSDSTLPQREGDTDLTIIEMSHFSNTVEHPLRNRFSICCIEIAQVLSPRRSLKLWLSTPRPGPMKPLVATAPHACID